MEGTWEVTWARLMLIQCSKMDNLSLVGEESKVSEAVETITFHGRRDLDCAGR